MGIVVTPDFGERVCERQQFFYVKDIGEVATIIAKIASSLFNFM